MLSVISVDTGYYKLNGFGPSASFQFHPRVFPRSNLTSLPVSHSMFLGMFKSHLLQHIKPTYKHRLFPPKLRLYSNASKPYNPIRILFCGADDFSIFSLKAIRELQQRKPECIASIDVVCRPDKRVGRGLKKVQEGMCKEGKALDFLLVW